MHTIFFLFIAKTSQPSLISSFIFKKHTHSHLHYIWVKTYLQMRFLSSKEVKSHYSQAAGHWSPINRTLRTDTNICQLKKKKIQYFLCHFSSSFKDMKHKQISIIFICIFFFYLCFTRFCSAGCCVCGVSNMCAAKGSWWINYAKSTPIIILMIEGCFSYL